MNGKRWKVKQLEKRYPGLMRMVDDGELTLDRAFQVAMARRTTPVYLKVQPELKKMIERQAKDRGID